MQPQPALILTTSLVFLGSLISWFKFLRAKRHGIPIWDYQPRTFVPWGIVDIGLIVLVTIAIQATVFGVFKKYYGISSGNAASVDDQVLVLLASSIGSLLSGIAAVILLKTRTGAAAHHIGWSSAALTRDVSSGITMFFLVVLPVFAIQFVLIQFFKPEHPLIKLLEENASPKFFLASGFMAVIVAPIVEELFFRIILQGWLENLAAYWTATRAEQATVHHERLILGGRPSRYNIALVGGSGHDENLDATPTATPAMVPVSEVAAESSPITLSPSRWPIIVTSALFAIAHWGHSTDPIPLFVFALALGYLYQRTHRIVPCIVVHMLLNGLSLLQLWLYLGADFKG